MCQPHRRPACFRPCKASEDQPACGAVMEPGTQFFPHFAQRDIAWNATGTPLRRVTATPVADSRDGAHRNRRRRPTRGRSSPWRSRRADNLAQHAARVPAAARARISFSCDANLRGSGIHAGAAWEREGRREPRPASTLPPLRFSWRPDHESLLRSSSKTGQRPSHC